MKSQTGFLCCGRSGQISGLLLIFKRNVANKKGFSVLGKIREDFRVIDGFQNECNEHWRIFCGGEDQGRLLSY